MNLVSYASNIQELDILKGQRINDVILAPRLLSRFGTIEFEDFIELSKYAKKLNLNVICEWDILLTENNFAKTLLQFEVKDFDHIDEFRVHDTGVLNYVLKNYKQKIQLITETGNHNLNSLLAFEKIVGERLSRFILSLELPQSKLKEFSMKLSCPVEILGFGRINLFYSPRKLISPHMEESKKNETIEIEVNSEESPHKGFPLLQNSHGTFMMNPKDHCLLENIDELEEAEVKYLRLDLRFDDSFTNLNIILNILNNVDREESLNKLKEINKRPLIRGFFRINKTDHQFKKLKNHRIQRKDKNYVGEVLDVKKGEYIGFRVKDNEQKILCGSWLELQTPEGKIKKIQIKKLNNSNREDIETVNLNQIVYINHISGISIRTAIYLSQ